ncbi:hypothetical protein AHAS_Ahas13G0142700 [Arachis hypogaea]
MSSSRNKGKWPATDLQRNQQHCPLRFLKPIIWPPSFKLALPIGPDKLPSEAPYMTLMVPDGRCIGHRCFWEQQQNGNIALTRGWPEFCRTDTRSSCHTDTLRSRQPTPDLVASETVASGSSPEAGQTLLDCENSSPEVWGSLRSCQLSQSQYCRSDVAMMLQAPDPFCYPYVVNQTYQFPHPSSLRIGSSLLVAGVAPKTCPMSFPFDRQTEDDDH